MGKKDVAVNRLLGRKPIFADLINGTLYEGRQVVKPEELEILSPQTGIILEDDGRLQDGTEDTKTEKDRSRTGSRKRRRMQVLGRTGDIRMRAETGTYSVIFAGEVQAAVHYAMPVRIMLYDALEYVKQVQDLEKIHRERKNFADSGEFLAGIARNDRLLPVINMVFYLGENWDGSRSLHELLALDCDSADAEKLRPYISNYHINLIPARAIKHPENYKTCLQQIFSMLKYEREDEEKLYSYICDHREELDRMDRVEEQAALILLGEQSRLKKWMEERRIEKKEEITMSQAITKLLNDREMKGETRGLKLGEARGIELGEARGMNRIMRLNQLLLEAGRYDDLKRASSDEAYLRKLCGEFGI